MKRRPARIAVKIEEAPESRPQPIHEIAAGMAALKPPETNAHDTDEQTPCRVCGGACPPRSPHWGPWRQHPACQTVAGDPVSRLQAASKALGHALDRQDAALTPFQAMTYAEVHREPTWSTEPWRERLPWRHLDKEGLYAALERLPGLRIEAGLVDNRCTDGACAWCGVLEARGWGDYGHHWPDGTSAPLCGPCGEVYERNGSPGAAYWPEQRAAIAEAVSGVPVPMGTAPPAGLLALAEVGDSGDGTPWSHLPPEPLEAYRWAAWGLYSGRFAPPEHRAEALARARAADAAKVQRQAARLAEEAARVDVYGFGGAA